jgi:hypothetical protein
MGQCAHVEDNNEYRFDGRCLPRGGNMSPAAWTAIAAGATALMAIATVFLALKTRSMAQETKKVADATLQEAKAVEQQAEQVERQVAISTEALRVSVQPWLVWEPAFEVQPSGGAPVEYRHGAMYSSGWHSCLNVSEVDDSVEGWLTVRNVGSGIAILDMSSSSIYPKNGAHALDGVRPSVASPVVPAGGTVDVEFTIPPAKSLDKRKMTLFELASGGGDQLFTVEIAYGDALGNAQTLAKFRAHRNEQKDPSWSIFEVEYRLGNGKVITTRRYG